jgi:hypothetical protein
MSLNPDTVFPGHEFARITRFVPSLPDGILCNVDKALNICTVNQALYDTLPPNQQKEVYRAVGTIRAEAPRPDAGNDDIPADWMVGVTA